MAGRMAVFNLSPAIGLAGAPFGKDVANLDLFRALARDAGLDQVDYLMSQPVPAAAVAARLTEGAPTPARITTHPLLDVAAPRAAGTLLRGSAELEQLAWRRRRACGDAGYSLIGLIHTLAPPAIRRDIAAATIGAVQPWDALVCTSPSVQDAMTRMFDEWEAHLRDRFGGTRAIRPQLPLIPLGVDADRLAAAADRPDARLRARDAIGAAPEDVVLLWVGRLSFFEKAFPQSMMRAAEEAARAGGGRLHLVMAGWFPDPKAHEPLYRAAAAAGCPSVAFHLVDGTDRARVDDLWAGGDIFVSLVDNIQETFGLTPLEAMAAGLPVVVSDWNGYRYTVRDGVEGMLVPTLAAPPGALPDWVTAGHHIGLSSYQNYAATVAQYAAVHVGRAGAVIAALAGSADLRRRMGTAGRRRVAETFAWRVVAPLYAALAADLGARRRRGAGGAASSGGWNPVAGDPLRDFAGFPTALLDDGVRLTLRADAARAWRAQPPLALDDFASATRATREEALAILDLLGRRGPLSVGQLLLAFPVERRGALRLSAVWLAKLGLVDWLEPA